MCSPALAAVAIGGGGLIQAKAAIDEGKTASKVAKINAGLAERQATDALERGRLEEQRHRMQVRQLMGAQKVGFAASNVSLASGNALATIEDTTRLGELDALTIRNNARLEAWGYRVRRDQFLFEGKLAKHTAKQKAFGSLLGAAGQSYLGYKQAGG